MKPGNLFSASYFVFSCHLGHCFSATCGQVSMQISLGMKLVETKDKLTKTFFSQSSYLALDNEKQKILSSKIQELYENLDDVIETDFYTTAYIAKRK